MQQGSFVSDNMVFLTPFFDFFVLLSVGKVMGGGGIGGGMGSGGSPFGGGGGGGGDFDIPDIESDDDEMPDLVD